MNNRVFSGPALLQEVSRKWLNHGHSLAFQMEDKWSRDFLVQHANDEANDIEFSDYSIQDPFDSKWKTECTKRIAATKGTIVMVGPTTYLIRRGSMGDSRNHSAGSLHLRNPDQ